MILFFNLKIKRNRMEIMKEQGINITENFSWLSVNLFAIYFLIIVKLFDNFMNGK